MLNLQERNCKNNRIKNLLDNKLIGRFSCLAIADLANITSYYNGKAYYYVMNKDIDQLHIDLLMEEATTEPNGVEVKVPNKKGIEKADLEDLYFIKNLYMNPKTSDSYINTLLQRFNDRILFDYETFKIALVEGYKQQNFKILIGNVLYNVDYKTILDTFTFNDWESTLIRIHPYLPIGSVDITPNRESLLYSERTKKCIKEAVETCIKKLTDLWNARQDESIDSIGSLIHKILAYRNNELLLDSVTIPLSSRLSHKVKYKDKIWNFKECKDVISNLRYGYKFICQGRWFLGEFSQNSFSRVTPRYFDFSNLLASLTDLRCKVFILPNDHCFTSAYFRPFLNDSYYNYRVLFLRKLPITPKSLKQIIYDIWSFNWSQDDTTKEKRDIIMTIIKDSLQYFKEHAIIEDVFNSKEFLQYKKEHRHKGVKRNTEVSRFFIWIPEQDKGWTYTGTAKQVINMLHDDSRYKKFRIVYASVDSLLLSSLTDVYKRLIVIKLNKTLYKSAKAGELFPDYIQEIDTLYEPDNRYLRKLATIHYLRKEHSEECFKVPLKAFPENIQDKMNVLRALNKEYPSLRLADAFTRAVEEVPKEKYDLEILSLFHETLYYQKFSANITSKEINCDSLFWYNILKAKCFLLDKEFYHSLKYIVKKNVNFITIIKNHACH